MSKLTLVVAFLFALFFAVAAQQDFVTAPLDLAEGVATLVTAPLDNDYCTYVSYAIPTGTGVITLEYTETTGDATISLLVNGFPRSYSFDNEQSGYSADTPGSQIVICSGQTTFSGCDYAVPGLHNITGATLNICISRWSTGSSAVAATIKATATVIQDTIVPTSTGLTVSPTVPAGATDDVYWAYLVFLGMNVTEFSITTSSSDARVFIPGITSSSGAWTSGNNYEHFVPGWYLVILQVGTSESAPTFTFVQTNACSAGGFGDECLTPVVLQATQSQFLSGVLGSDEWVAFELPLPAEARLVPSVSVVFNFTDNDFGNSVRVDFSGGAYPQGQVPDVNTGTISIDGNGVGGIVGIRTDLPIYFAFRNWGSFSDNDYNVTVTVTNDFCLNGGTANPATYSCTCPAGFFGHNCLIQGVAYTTAPTTVQVTDAMSYVTAVSFVAAANTNYLVNASLAAGASSLDLSTFAVVVDIEHPVTGITQGNDEFSIFIPAEHFVAGQTYWVLGVSTSATAPRTFSVSLTTSTAGNADTSDAASVAFNKVFLAVVVLLGSLFLLF
jgi:hypothetical protein